MKKVIVILLLLVALGAAAPFGFGFWADARLAELVAEANKSGVVDFTIIKTEKGWFTTQVILEAEPSGKLADSINKSKMPLAAGSKLVLRGTIYHGPFPFMNGSLSMIPVIGTMDSRFVKGIDSTEGLVNIDYSMKVIFALTGNTNVKIDIPAWNGPLGKGDANLEWKGLRGDISFSSGMKSAKMDIKAPFMKVLSKKGTLLMESFSIESDSKEGIEGLSLGNANFKIGKIEFKEAMSGSDFKMSDAAMVVNSGATGDNVYMDMSLNIANVIASGEQYGPFVFKFGLKNLDAGALARIQEKVNAASEGKLPPDQVKMMMATTMMAEMSNLLTKGPVVEIPELSLRSTVGNMMGSARLSVDTSKPALLANPFLIKNALVGEVDIEISEKLMVAMTLVTIRKEFKEAQIKYTEDQLKTMAQSRVNKRMSGLVAANMFVKDGDMYRFKAGIKDGIPTVNGQPFQMPVGGARR